MTPTTNNDDPIRPKTGISLAIPSLIKDSIPKMQLSNLKPHKSSFDVIATWISGPLTSNSSFLCISFPA